MNCLVRRSRTLDTPPPFVWDWERTGTKQQSSSFAVDRRRYEGDDARLAVPCSAAPAGQNPAMLGPRPHASRSTPPCNDLTATGPRPALAPCHELYIAATARHRPRRQRHPPACTCHLLSPVAHCTAQTANCLRTGTITRTTGFYFLLVLTKLLFFSHSHWSRPLLVKLKIYY